MVDPTYRDLGNHSEAIAIDFDPALITYEDLLDIYWDSHRPTRKAWSNQYASSIFFQVLLASIRIHRNHSRFQYLLLLWTIIWESS